MYHTENMTIVEGKFMEEKTDITLANAANGITFHMQPNIKHSLLNREVRGAINPWTNGLMKNGKPHDNSYENYT